MPLDASIYKQIEPIQIGGGGLFGSPQLQASLALAQERQQKIRDMRDQQLDLASINDALRQSVDPNTGIPDFDQAIGIVAQRGRGKAVEALTKISDEHKSKAVATGLQYLKARKDELDLGLQIIGMANEDGSNWAPVRGSAIGVGVNPKEQQALAALIPEQFPGADGLRQIRQGALSAKELLDFQQKAIEAAPKTAEEWKKYLAPILSHPAMTKEEWNNNLDFAALVGGTVGKGMRSLFGEFSPENQARAKQLVTPDITPFQAEEIKAREQTHADLQASREQQAQAAQQAHNDLQAYRNFQMGMENRREGRLEKEKVAAAGDVTADARTTLSGKKYVDLGEYETPTARQAAREAAKKAGLMVVDKATGDSLRAADTAKLNMTSLWNNIQSHLPKDAKGRVIAGPSNKLSQYFQTSDDLAAYAAWRGAAIQAIQAFVERGMGFRLNQAEIKLIQENDMPQITDTIGTAQKRISIIMRLLQDKEDVSLTRDRSTLAPSTGIVAPAPVGPAATPAAGKKGDPLGIR